jgi:5-methylcytosine-specific restriction endonuclease McrA
MKTCRSCRKSKEEKLFYFTKYITKGGEERRYLHPECSSCATKRNRIRVLARHDEFKAYQKAYQRTVGREKRAERFVWMDELKSKPCEDCGECFPPECMDFDHKNPKDKLFDVSRAVVSGRAASLVKEEIAKCRLICSNCHRIRTARQQNRGRAAKTS